MIRDSHAETLALFPSSVPRLYGKHHLDSPQILTALRIIDAVRSTKQTSPRRTLCASPLSAVTNRPHSRHEIGRLGGLPHRLPPAPRPRATTLSQVPLLAPDPALKEQASENAAFRPPRLEAPSESSRKYESP